MSINIIIGPPCAGKSTYVRDNAAAGDVTVDFDTLARALGSPGSHAAEGAVKQVAFAARAAAIEKITQGVPASSWIIHTRPSAAQLEQYEKAGAIITLVDPGLDECLARASEDKRPDRTAQVIQAWYETPPIEAIKAARTHKCTGDGYLTIIQALRG